MSQLLPQRSQVPIGHTWDAASVFPNDAAWEKEYARVTGVIDGLDKYRNHLGDGPAVLAEWLDTVWSLEHEVTRIQVYATLFHTVDMANQSAGALYSRGETLWARLLGSASFAEPEILGIGLEKLALWAKAEPRLAIYSHYFDRISAKSAHVRSAEVEEVLGRVSEPFGSARRIHGILSEADIRFKPARSSNGEDLEVAHGTIGSLLTSPDRETRRTAFESYADAFLDHKNTTANCLATGVKQDVFMTRARRYSTSLDAALSASNIPQEVFHNLIGAFKANLPTWHRYWELRRRALGLDKLHVYDINARLT